MSFFLAVDLIEQPKGENVYFSSWFESAVHCGPEAIVGKNSCDSRGRIRRVFAPNSVDQEQRWGRKKSRAINIKAGSLEIYFSS